ncbi:importin subunit beta-3 [Stygiomarasmius scandens]|uniref:Importin subunit beta-3 n=1 Tax=Marasmiellus scandens TaxID=2682957 RepID=A0ABR1JD64_9AGAR
MEPVVPHEITAELTQILSNLVLGDNEIRSNAEKAVNERLASTPDLYLLALTQFAISADTDVMRSFSLVLLRRLLFRPVPQGQPPHPSGQQGQGQGGPSAASGSATSGPRPAGGSFYSLNAPRLSLYDHMSTPALQTLEKLLLYSLIHETSASVRRKAVDTVADVANQGMSRGRPWHALQVVGFGMAGVGASGSPPSSAGATAGGESELTRQLNSTPVPPRSLRESAYTLFSLSPMLISDLSPESVVSLLLRGLRDPESLDVRYAAVKASVGYLQGAEGNELARVVNVGSVGVTPEANQQAGTTVGQALMFGLLEGVSGLVALLGSTGGSIKTPGPHSAPPNPLLQTTSSGSSPSGKDKAGSGTKPPSPTHALHQHLAALTPLASSHPTLFLPHLAALLNFLPSLVLPLSDPGMTPRPKRGNSDPDSPSKHPLWASHSNGDHDDHGMDEDDEDADDEAEEEEEERQGLRLAALEFMLSLCEARPGMFKVRSSSGGEQTDASSPTTSQSTIASTWISLMVRACLEGMAEIDEDTPFGVPGGLAGWLAGDPSTSSSVENDSPPALYEQSLDRVACAMGGRAVLPPAFQYIPSMLASYDWRARHAGLMAIAAIGEGTGKVMISELGKIVELVVPMFRDTHPRVRYAACQCVGQLCTDLEEVIQEQYHQQLFSVLIPTLEDPEPRVHAHAAAALINFCEGVERDTLVPYLDPIVERLLRLLNPAGNQAEVKRYVQEQAITTLAMVADASETVFAKHYATIMPLLLNVLRNADGPEYRRMRVKAMECAGLIAIAVGRDTFRPDANTLVELLIRIQKSPIDPQDTQLSHYLMGTWAKICQAMGVEFEPYLPVVMPDLLTTASAKADVSVYDDEDGKVEEREGWETVNMDGQTLGIRTSAIEEKCQAFETMVIYASTLQGRYAPYLAQSLEVTLPALRFYFHDGVREACAMLIPMLIQAGHLSNTLTNQMVSATLLQLINVISDEHDASFLASLFKAFTDCVKILGGPSTCLSPEYLDGIIEATKRQLQTIAQKRRAREAGRGGRGSESGGHVDANGLDEDDREDLALLEEMEDFALEDMARMLRMLDQNHELLVAVGSVKDLGMNKYLSGDEEE